MLWFKVLSNKKVLLCPMDALLVPSLLPGSHLELCQALLVWEWFHFVPCLFPMLPQHLGLFSSDGASVTPARVCHLSLSPL